MTTDQSPQISVIIPVYNVAAYLDKCLASVTAQTFSDFEVICINDGSTDGSVAILEKYLAACSRPGGAVVADQASVKPTATEQSSTGRPDGRFRMISQPNSGYGAAMNRGLRAARGKYIAILESDDFYAPDTLERLYQTAESFAAQVVKANCWFYWSGPPEKNVLYELVPRSQTGRLINPQVDHQIFYLTPAVWAALYRRDHLLDNDIYFNETAGASYQDTAFNFKVWLNTKRAVFLPQAHVHYRQDNQNSSVNTPGKVYCVCDEYAEMERYLAAWPQATEHNASSKNCAVDSVASWVWPLKARLKYDTYMWNYERLGSEYQLPFLERFASEMSAELAAGHLDWQFFEEWNSYDLKLLLHCPSRYHQERQSTKSYTRWGKARRYLKIGGLPLLAKVVKNKLLHSESTSR